MHRELTTRRDETSDAVIATLEAGVHGLPRAPLSYGESPLNHRRQLALARDRRPAAGAAGSVRRTEYKTRVIRCSLRTGQGLITPVRSAFPSDALPTIGTSVGEGRDEPCGRPRLASEHQMTIGGPHELECCCSG
jgi:hypothetical protein